MVNFMNIAINNKGWTLTELMVVVGIAGFLAFLAVTALPSKKSRTDFDNNAYQVRDTLALARNIAVFQVSCVTVTNDNTTLSVIQNDGSNCAYPYAVGTNSTTVSSLTLPSGTSFSPNFSSLSFDQTGGLMATTPFATTFSDGTFARSLKVFPGTGIVRIK